MPFREYEELGSGDIRWHWRGFLAPRTLTMLTAPPKTGKTTFLAHMLKAWTDDQPAFVGQEFQVRPEAILIVSEEPEDLIRERCAEMGLTDPRILWRTLDPQHNTWSDVLSDVYTATREFKQGLVVIDTLSRHWGVNDEDDAAQINKALLPLLVLARNSNWSWLVTHHNRKSGGAYGASVRGSNALVANVDILLELARLTPFDPTPRRRIDTLSRYSSTPESFKIVWDEQGYRLLDDENVEPAVLLAISMGAETLEDICLAQAISEEAARACLANLLGRAIVERGGSGSDRSPYRYSMKAVG